MSSFAQHRGALCQSPAVRRSSFGSGRHAGGVALHAKLNAFAPCRDIHVLEFATTVCKARAHCRCRCSPSVIGQAHHQCAHSGKVGCSDSCAHCARDFPRLDILLQRQRRGDARQPLCSTIGCQKYKIQLLELLPRSLQTRDPRAWGRVLEARTRQCPVARCKV